jgi:hypothetical protein
MNGKSGPDSEQWTSVGVHPSTLERIKNSELVDGEVHDSVINRALDALDVACGRVKRA